MATEIMIESHLQPLMNSNKQTSPTFSPPLTPSNEHSHQQHHHQKEEEEKERIKELKAMIKSESSAEGRAQVAGQLSTLVTQIEKTIETRLPELAESSRYYFRLDGKRLRPQLVLLMTRAVFDHLVTVSSNQQQQQQQQTINNKEEGRREEHHQQQQQQHERFSTTEKQQEEQQRVGQAAVRLAEMVEMVHTASLIHDDVIDNATSRRGAKAINAVFGNRVSILCGDFLMARVSRELAELKEHRVNEMLSEVLADLVKGEFLQMGPGRWQTTFEHYMDKTYKKTASLVAKGCACAAVLAGGDQSHIDAAEAYGRHLGLAFQIIDDLLDIVSTEAELGKEPCVDLKLGLATAPVLFAAQEHAELAVMIERRFCEPDDVLRASAFVQQSRGVEKTRQLAEQHILAALAAISTFENSAAKDALVAIAVESLSRRK